MAKVAVIGRGFAGLTTALVLARSACHEVHVLGPKTTPLTASTAAHGASTIKGLLEASQELFQLKMTGHISFLTWLAGVEKDSGLLVPKILGVVEPFWDRSDFRTQQARIYKNRFLGAFCHLDVTGNPPVLGIFNQSYYLSFYPRDFWIDTDIYLNALQLACTAHGVRFSDDGLVKNITETTNSCFVETVHATSRPFDFVVVCVGAGTPFIRGIREQTGHLLGVSGSTFAGENSGFGSDFCAVKNLNALACYGEILYLGSSTDHKGSLLEDFQPQVLSSQMSSTPEDMFSKVWGRAPEESLAWKRRFGVRVRTKSRMPLIEKLDLHSRIILNTGYYKSGLTLTPLGARRVKSLVEGF